MALDKTATLAWVRTNIKTVTPASPAVATNRAYLDPDDYATLATTPTLPFHGLFYDDGGATYGSMTSNSYSAGWVLTIETYLHKGSLQRFSKQRAELQLIGRAYCTALTNWLLSNRTLGGTVASIGDSDGLLTSYELVSLRPWDQHEVFGSLVIVPIVAYTG